LEKIIIKNDSFNYNLYTKILTLDYKIIYTIHSFLKLSNLSGLKAVEHLAIVALDLETASVI